VTRDLTGSATLAKPTVTGASNIGTTSLTLNWNAVTDAAQYEVNVYTKATGTVTATDLFISEYVEGTSNNKALEIFNGTGADVDLSQYSLKKQTNGAGDYTNEKILSGTLVNGDVYVIANTSANSSILAKADLTENSITSYNGNDAIGLFKNGTQIDEVGVLNQVENWGADVTLVRKSSVTSPKVPYDANDWNSLATDNIDNLGSHTMDGFGTIKTPVSGSPFTTSGTSQEVAGLTAATTYYYTVTAKNGSYVSPASDEASASTLQTATPNVSVQGIFVRNGKVIVTAPAAGERIEIFNAVGQRLVSKLSTAGENSVSVSAKGILLVKFGSQVTKVMLP
jgi:predicted extracellular nuclease